MKGAFVLLSSLLLIAARKEPPKVPKEIAFAQLMNVWAEQMAAQNYTAAASVYLKLGKLTVDGASYQGLEEIEAFFTILGDLAEKYDYAYHMCLSDNCTFRGQYDFGAGMKYDFEITLRKGKIRKEVVTSSAVNNDNGTP